MSIYFQKEIENQKLLFKLTFLIFIAEKKCPIVYMVLNGKYDLN